MILLQVLLRDPSDENVIPVLKELERRLPVGNEAQHGQGDGKESSAAQNDADAGEEDGTYLHKLFSFFFKALVIFIF